MLALLKTHLEISNPWLSELVADSQQTLGPVRRWWRFRKVHRIFGIKFWALISGGGALAGPLEQFWNALGFVVVQGYGMTETTALITLNHPFHVTKGTIGKPLSGREVKLGPDGEVLVRGAAISGATWTGGKLHRRKDEWLATGDLAETEPSGELRFLGRKSEVIVTAAGVNIHPEDLEGAIEEQPGVAACAVVAMETAEGPEPCAVLACRGTGNLAAMAIENANTRLAEFQRVRRWVLWPQPDLPRTSTGKVRRKAVSAWLQRIQSAATNAGNGISKHSSNGAFGVSEDWLLALISQISGEPHPGVGDELHLTEDLHLDSLGRVQLAAAIEDRLGIISEDGMLDRVETLGQLRRLVAGGENGNRVLESAAISPEGLHSDEAGGNGAPPPRPYEKDGAAGEDSSAETARARYVYPRWPWLFPFQWIRVAFIEAVMRPLVWLLAAPRVAAHSELEIEAVKGEAEDAHEPMLIVANHVTAFDAPLVQYALPGVLRRRIAIAMSGEMLDAYRHFRNLEPRLPSGRFFLPGPLYYYLLAALFNVFPLPRRRDFQPSFAHAGRAMDRGFNVLVFPEGMRTAEGKLAPFRPGIGLLAKQCGAMVLPVGIRGLGELKTGERRWFRSGTIEVLIGKPQRFSSAESEAAITARLHDEVERLMEGG